VKRLNLQQVYMLGRRLGAISDISSETRLRAVALDIYWAKDALNEIIKEPSPLLDVSRRAAGNLIAAIDKLLPADFSTVFDKEREDIRLAYSGYDIKKKLEEFESVLSNEMPGVPSFLVSKKGIYSTDDLIFRAESHFPPSVLSHVSEQTRWDVNEAGKCLAFEVPTACAFHLWRAVEDSMCVYYEALTGQSADEGIKNKNWGTVIDALNDAGAAESVTKFLHHIRQEYRNPQLHPEEIVDIDRAQALFGVAASAITQLAIATKTARDTHSTPALPLAGSFSQLLGHGAEPEANDEVIEVEAQARPAAGGDLLGGG
jgi:hypothetical protein